MTSGGTQPVTLEAPVMAALHVATPGQPSPRQEVGVVLDGCGDDHVKTRGHVKMIWPPAALS
jgi:hypothetical protein